MMMASENPTLNNRGTEMLRWWQASIMTVQLRQLTELVFCRLNCLYQNLQYNRKSASDDFTSGVDYFKCQDV
jgi:hypothetical protein